MIEDLKRPIKELKDEYVEMYFEFLDYAGEYGGCNCHSNPPCVYCTHDGNPLNLNETDDAWLD